MSTTTGYAALREERRWNRLSQKMSAFHDWFKEEFNEIYTLADGSFNSIGLPLARYLDKVTALNHHLTMHHTIEERHLFPILAKTMHQFAADDGEHLASHHGIHEGLERLQKLVRTWKDSPSTYSPTEMRECLDSFRDVLFKHLDQEVEDLRGENLKKYIKLEDLESLPI